MTPAETKDYVDNRYKELIEGQELPPENKLTLVNQILAELRGYHKTVVTFMNAPIKGVTLEPTTKEVIYHAG